MSLEIAVQFNQEPFVFRTAHGLFSPAAADRGSLAMLHLADLAQGQRVLDLGCGYGLIGICAARTTGDYSVWMLDVNPDAIAASKENAERNGVKIADFICSDGAESLLERGLAESFDRVYCNPPYHVDFSVARRFIESSYQLLAVDGTLTLVVKRLTWYKNKLTHVFGGVGIREVDGYFLLIAQKRQSNISLSSRQRQSPTKKNNRTIKRKHLKKIRNAQNKKKSDFPKRSK